MDKQQNDGKGTVGVLGYATAERRGLQQSRWGITAVSCGAAAVGLIVYVWVGGDIIIPNAIIPSVPGMALAGVVCGMLGVAQRRRSRGLAAVGLALCLLELVAMGVLFVLLTKALEGLGGV